MTLFEQWSLVAYYLQLLLISGGLWMMHKSGQRRDRQLDTLISRSEEQGSALRESTAGLRAAVNGIEKLLERMT